MKTSTATGRQTLLKAAMAAASLVTLLTACGAEKPPVSVEKDSQMTAFGDTPYIRITSNVDQLRLSALKINRGNCNWGGSQKRPPVDMVFGQALIYVAVGCNIAEVEIATDKGDYTFTF